MERSTKPLFGLAAALSVVALSCASAGDPLHGARPAPIAPRMWAQPPYPQKINQGLKIVRAAVAAAETDPSQAMRAMLAQATTLQAIATDFHLTLAASEFYRHLTRHQQSGEPLTRALAQAWAVKVLTFLPKDADADRKNPQAA